MRNRRDKELVELLTFDSVLGSRDNDVLTNQKVSLYIRVYIQAQTVHRIHYGLGQRFSAIKRGS